MLGLEAKRIKLPGAKTNIAVPIHKEVVMHQTGSVVLRKLKQIKIKMAPERGMEKHS